jgi:hypothetical protein
MHPRTWLPIVVILFVWSLTTHGKFSNSGDEPHYLMIAESLVSDGDLDLENNFREGDQRWFGADDLEPGPHARRTRWGALWSVHDVGVAVLVAPVYAVASRLAARVPEPWLARVRQTRGLFAYSLVSLTLIVLTALAVRLLYLAFGRRAPSRRAAAVALVLALSPPVLAHAFLIFPETIAFAVVCAVVWALCADPRELTAARVAAIVLAVGLLPWLHRKYAPLVLGLAILVAHHHWSWIRAQPWRTQVGFAAAALVPQLGLYAWTWHAWGNLGGPHMLQDVPLSLAWLQEGALGMLLDRERGLLGYAPVYLLAPACFALSWRDSRWLLVPIAMFYLPMASYATWDAGFSPAARFLVPLTPLVGLAALRALESRVLRLAVLPLLAFQAAIAAVVWNHPRALWPKEQASNQALDAIPIVGPAWSSALPSLHTGESVRGGWIAIAGMAVVNLALVLAHRSRISAPPPRHRPGSDLGSSLP